MPAPSAAHHFVGRLPSRIRRALGAPVLALVLAAVGAGSGCAHVQNFPGTTIPANEENKSIIETVETYRQRLLQRNVEGLLVLASPHYFEDSGTPRADDDYGYEGLRQVLLHQLDRVKAMRYDIEYRHIHVTGNQAEVEVFLNGSFELASTSGDRYRRVNDYHHFVLERSGDNHWKFLSGM